MVTAEQIRAARALLRMEQDELARRASVSISTIRRLESPSDEYPVAEATASGVQSVLQEAGVEFILDGVRLKKTTPSQEALFNLLYAIAEDSAARLAENQPYSDADLYGDDGLPA